MYFARLIQIELLGHGKSLIYTVLNNVTCPSVIEDRNILVRDYDVIAIFKLFSYDLSINTVDSYGHIY